ncbi:hypothetical protein COP2_033914 [Malus domestica]
MRDEEVRTLDYVSPIGVDMHQPTVAEEPTKSGPHEGQQLVVQPTESGPYDQPTHVMPQSSRLQDNPTPMFSGLQNVEDQPVVSGHLEWATNQQQQAVISGQQE